MSIKHDYRKQGKSMRSASDGMYHNHDLFWFNKDGSIASFYWDEIDHDTPVLGQTMSAWNDKNHKERMGKLTDLAKRAKKGIPLAG